MNGVQSQIEGIACTPLSIHRIKQRYRGHLNQAVLSLCLNSMLEALERLLRDEVGRCFDLNPRAGIESGRNEEVHHNGTDTVCHSDE